MIFQLIRIFLPIFIVGLIFVAALIVSGQNGVQRLYKKIGPLTIYLALLCSFIMFLCVFLNSEETHDKNAKYVPAHFDSKGNFVEREIEDFNKQ